MRAALPDLRDGLVLGLATFPLALVVTKVGLQSGLEPGAILASSALIASAAVQLILYQMLSDTGALGLWSFGLMAMVSFRLVLYSCDLNREVRDRPAAERLASAFFIGDTAYLEFKRALSDGGGPRRALGRFKSVSRTMWACWQVGTLTGLATDLTLPGLPKEAVNVLIFSCLALTMFSQPRAA